MLRGKKNKPDTGSTVSKPAAATVQPKLSVGAVNDPLETEADAVANKVMSMPETKIVQRKCDHCEEEEKLQRKPLASFVQRKESSSGMIASSEVSNTINTLKGSGTNMDPHTQSFMENRFGSDFSDVKIHTGNEAIQMNRELNAKAFTTGSDIYFNEGRYQPGTSDGKQLLAHELTHTIQQENTQSKKSIQKKNDSDCPAKYSKASNFKDLVKLVAEAEKELISCGYTTIEERVHIIRGLYYGTTWSMDYDVEKSPVRNLAFNVPYTGSTEPDDPRKCLDCSLIDALKKSAEVTDGKRSFDFGHAIIGMDARRSVVARNINIPTQGGTGLDIVTWLGDLGGGAGMLSIRRMTDPTRRVKTVFTGSDFGGAVNLEGDIGGFLLARDTTSSSISNLDFTGKTYLWETLDNYLDPAAKGSDWNNRCQLFLAMLGGTFTGTTLTNRSTLETSLAGKIRDFGLWYMINRLRQTGTFSKKTATDASKHLVGASSEVTKVFLDIMTSCATGAITTLKPVSDPAPTAPGNALSEVEGFFSTKEKAEDLYDSAKKWWDKL